MDKTNESAVRDVQKPQTYDTLVVAMTLPVMTILFGDIQSEFFVASCFEEIFLDVTGERFVRRIFKESYKHTVDEGKMGISWSLFAYIG